MEQTEYSETLAYKIQTPGNHPKESIQQQDIKSFISVQAGGVTGFFSDIFISDRTMALGSTQPLAKMSTRHIPGGKGGQCVRVTSSPPSSAECHEIWEPKPLEPSGPHQACNGAPLR